MPPLIVPSRILQYSNVANKLSLIVNKAHLNSLMCDVISSDCFQNVLLYNQSSKCKSASINYKALPWLSQIYSVF